MHYVSLYYLPLNPHAIFCSLSHDSLRVFNIFSEGCVCTCVFVWWVYVFDNNIYLFQSIVSKWIDWNMSFLPSVLLTVRFPLMSVVFALCKLAPGWLRTEQTDPFGVNVEAETEVGKSIAETKADIIDQVCNSCQCNSLQKFTWSFPQKTPNCTIQHKAK